jgi:hypothetical protein
VNPKHPVYVPSKGRSATRKTHRALTYIGVPHRMVVEPQEYDKYAAVVDPSIILTLDKNDQGLHYARNWIWEHALSEGAEWFWQIDDNIEGFHRYNNNLRVPCMSGTIFRLAEDFCERFENVGQGGFQYYMFMPRKQAHKFPPIFLNTRIYSCTLNRADLPFRYRAFYNDDTDLSLQILKAGWCTILFNAFQADKIATMTVKGGLTEHYTGEGESGTELGGRLDMARQLVELHPDVTRIVYRWGRYQHLVDYRPFKANMLKPKPGVYESLPRGFDEHGLKLQHRVDDVWVEDGYVPKERGM